MRPPAAFYFYSLLILITATLDVVVGSLLIPDYCLLPESQHCPNEEITFYLYSRANNYREYKLDPNDRSSIEKAPLVADCPLKFLVHGYTGHKDYTPNMELRPAYYESRQPVNIISIDYKNLVAEGCYVAAVKNVPLVAKCAAQFLDTFFEIRDDVPWQQLHVIGMSLGAQVSGHLRFYLKNGPISRITGLDSAMPLFFSHVVPDKKYLNKGDALVVDVIHTNGGQKGKLLTYADIDFYANGGRHQPQCQGNSSCSHAAAAVYYAESINSQVGFWGRRCSYHNHIFGLCDLENQDWNLFGEYTILSNHGTFWFDTNKKPPYAKGKNEDN